MIKQIESYNLLPKEIKPAFKEIQAIFYATRCGKEVTSNFDKIIFRILQNKTKDN